MRNYHTLIIGTLSKSPGLVDDPAFRCEPRIYGNEIRENHENGINVMGDNNETKIEHNPFIEYNKKAGIRVCDKARAIIKENGIGRNLGQGILVVETASAHIKKNKISDNIKANIGVGGAQSVNTTIIDNEIINGRAEGIFLVNCERTYVARNVISNNHDGIVMFTAMSEIIFNTIRENKSNGILMFKGSLPVLRNNEIIENDGIGMYIRDKSGGENMFDNTIKDNQIQLVVEKKNILLNDILVVNTVIGDTRVPKNYEGCSLI